MSDSETERLHCNRCGHKTEHVKVAKHRYADSEDIPPWTSIDWLHVYEMFACRGCNEVLVRQRFYFSEWAPDEVEETFYPPRVSRRYPEWKDQIRIEGLASLLEEVYAALHADSRCLAMMGARAIVDMVILNQVGDVGTFTDKLKALQSGGFLSGNGRKILEAALNVGNAASHRGFCPEPEHVHHVMEIVENLVHSTLLLPLADELNAVTPKREKNSQMQNESRK